jgi:hypothetical protein
LTCLFLVALGVGYNIFLTGGAVLVEVAVR